MAGVNPLEDRELPLTTGLLEIADQADIKHGCYVGAPDQPYVATTDLVLTIGVPSARRLVFWSCKPAELMAHGTRRQRILERIELERRYAHAVGAKHIVFDSTQACTRLVANLDWLEPPIQERTDADITATRKAFADRFNESCAAASIEQRIQSAANSIGIDISSGQRHFRTAAWLGQIDIDLSHPVLMTRPMRTGGSAIKLGLQKTLLGETT